MDIPAKQPLTILVKLQVPPGWNLQTRSTTMPPVAQEIRVDIMAAPTAPASPSPLIVN